MRPADPSAPLFGTDRKVRLGVWGLGRGLQIIRTARAVNVEVVAGCDFNPHFLAMFRDAVPESRFTADAAEFLSWDFDAVLVATYCPAHARHAIEAMRAGKHVLSEVTAFHTIAEAVELIETVEATGRVYQLAENYPYTPVNRFLARKWRQGVFGRLLYGEYSYLHDCLDLAFTYIDRTPVQPETSPHNWRSWLPWHYYNTHSLGPIMVITGERPARVTAFPGEGRLPGHLMPAPEGMSGAAPSLIEMEGGALVRNLMGGMTDDTNVQRLIGDRGGAEWSDGRLRLRLGGRGHSPKREVQPDDDAIGKLAASSGHGGGDFWTLYHFANEILNRVKGPFDVCTAADVTLPGIQAFRSALEGGRPQEIPDLRDPAARDHWRSDTFAPARLDTARGVFMGKAVSGTATRFNSVMKALLEAADIWESFFAWTRVLDGLSNRMPVLESGYRALDEIDGIQTAVRDAEDIRRDWPGTDGSRALAEVMTRLDSEAILRGRGSELIRNAIDALILDSGPSSALFPQLEMRRERLDDLPELAIPSGYSHRTFREGDSVHWRSVIASAFNEERDEEAFRRDMLYRPDANLSRIHFLCRSDGLPVATAAAYGDDECGYVHYVGVQPSHHGLGLGRLVTLAVLRDMRERGCRAARLHTDDWRLHAIKTYQRLGFHPALTHRSHPDRWRLLSNTSSPEMGQAGMALR